MKAEKFEAVSDASKMSAAEMVIGSALGAYIGFSLTTEGAIEGDRIGLLNLLIVLVAFFYQSNLAFKLKYIKKTDEKALQKLLFFTLAPFVFGGFSIYAAERVGLDGFTLAVLLTAWIFAITLDAFRPLLRREKND